MIRKLLFIITLFFFNFSNAQTTLSSLFKDHMVLQQQEKVNIWGTDKANTKIKVIASWGQEESITTNKNGTWKLKIKTPKAGGPYTVTIKGSKKVILKDVMIGEVWLCSGQSNMSMPMAGYNNQPINHSQETILNSTNNNIRVFTVKKNNSLSPINNLEGDWKKTTIKNTGHFSATAYFFAKKLESILKVPVGIIVTSWGGSSAEAWTDKETLQQFKTIEIPKKVRKYIQGTPTVLYNAMIHPILGYHIKGSIWYQGEANVKRPKNYNALMNAMVTSWRKKWDIGDFSFYTTQVAPYNYKKEYNAAYLREAQLQTSQTLKNSGMAVTLDIGDCAYIHPREKKTIGNRLAYWALTKDYNIDGIEFSGPIYQSMKSIDDRKIELTFGGTEYGISSFGKTLTGFEIAGEDKIFYPANASITRKKNTLIVSSNKVEKPIAVRYNFTSCPTASLFSSMGLPASSFRTDNW